MAELDRPAARLRRPADAALPRRAALASGSAGGVYLKREDLAHTGAHKINNARRPGAAREADGQEADHRRDRRRPARRRDRDRLRAARPRVRRLHGHRGHPPPGAERRAHGPARRRGGARSRPGRATLKEAVSAAIRDWVTNVATTHYIIGSAVGPAPYPALVRDLQRVIGDEAREQALDAEGALPERVIACVGGGSNAIGTFTAFVDDAEVELIGVEAAGEGLETGRHGASLVGGPHRRPARRALGGARRRRGPDPRGALDLRRARLSRASAPSTPTCATPAGPRYVVGRPTARRCAPSASSARLEGIIPALEPCHAIAWLLGRRHEPERPATTCSRLSRPRRQGPRRGRRPLDDAAEAAMPERSRAHRGRVRGGPRARAARR